MTDAIGYAAKSRRTSLKPHAFTRRTPGPQDVEIDVMFCGVCHSDLHQVRNEWKNTVYPCMPGHEIVGRVSRVGSGVTLYEPGDLVGVGCMVDSCGECSACREGLEQYCEGPKGATLTYNGPLKPDGTNTFGGYSDRIVVRESFVVRIPTGMSLSAAAPLLCAGITTYSPLRHWKCGPGKTVGVVGLGGLGHMAVKLARAMGADVTVITRSKKKSRAAKRLGAVNVIISTDEKAMARHELSFDIVLNTIPDPYDINPYIPLLNRDGVLVVVGLLGEFRKPTNSEEVAMHRRSVCGSLIGGVAETQEVLDFCANHGITADVEIIPIQDINDALDRMQNGEVRFRYVIDMESIGADRGGDLFSCWRFWCYMSNFR